MTLKLERAQPPKQNANVSLHSELVVVSIRKHYVKKMIDCVKQYLVSRVKTVSPTCAPKQKVKKKGTRHTRAN